MAWIVPAVLGITSMISQNAQNKAAIKNNENQQAAAEENAQKSRAQAMQAIAPFTAPGATPFANKSISTPGASTAAPGANAYGLNGTGGQVNAASVMQGGPQGQPQGQPPQQGQMDPKMMAMFMQFLKSAMGGQQQPPPPAQAAQRQIQPVARQMPAPNQVATPRAV